MTFVWCAYYFAPYKLAFDIKITTFNWTILNKETCSQQRQPLLLIIIRSSPDRWDRRKAIRATWGDPCTYDRLRVRYMFLIGTYAGWNKMRVNQLLQLESNLYGDIAQYDYADGYARLPLKQIAAFTIATKYCSNFPFVFMTDEDFFVHIPNLVSYIEQINTDEYATFIGGYVYNDSSPVRQRLNRYYVPAEVYPNGSYPWFTAGGATLLTTQLIGRLLEELPKLPMRLHLEDVTTGIVLEKLRVKPRNIEKICILWGSCQDIPLELRIAVHGYETTADLKRDWNKLKLPSTC
ncbi:hypothetical protein EG68_12582 [Paragonimus skrjabini miyazakii]|uniref:Hexosyltransferase n=1 Tax=Paragonimus skrjabini miyazakii TaxID=59628 RepID=A0A8S9YCR2_9TREM|nr:hypothetical protein EG68_12582 [Paragonimus skrjabini miyazakii]